MLNLDTHILIFAFNDELSKKEKDILSNDSWGISAIVLWEITKLSQLGRIKLHLEHESFLRLLGRVQVLPIGAEVCLALGRLDFKSDPADELIAATSLAYQLPLVTRDKKIKKSKIVPFA